MFFYDIWYSVNQILIGHECNMQLNLILKVILLRINYVLIKAI